MFKALQNGVLLFLAPYALVLVGLQADGVDRHAGVQAAVDQDFIIGGQVEVVQQQRGVRVGLMGRLKHGLDQPDTAQHLAQAGDRIIILVIDGHDDHFVDDVPHVHQTLEVRHVAVDALQLLAQDGLVVILEQPLGTGGMPAQGVALEGHVLGAQELRRPQILRRLDLAFFRLKAAPVEGQRAEVEQAKPLLHAVLQAGLASLILSKTVGIRDGLKRAAAKEELMIHQLEVHRLPGHGVALLIHNADRFLCFAMGQLVHFFILRIQYGCVNLADIIKQVG